MQVRRHLRQRQARPAELPARAEVPPRLQPPRPPQRLLACPEALPPQPASRRQPAEVTAMVAPADVHRKQ